MNSEQENKEMIGEKVKKNHSFMEIYSFECFSQSKLNCNQCFLISGACGKKWKTTKKRKKKRNSMRIAKDAIRKKWQMLDDE